MSTILTKTTMSIVECSLRLRAADLEDYPLVYLLSFTEAHEFLHDLITSDTGHVFYVQPYTPATAYETAAAERLHLRPLDFNPPGIPNPRSGRVIWCTYYGVTLAIKGDKDA